MSKRVQIAFDLDTNKLKEVYTRMTQNSYTNAYKDIQKYMLSKGYEHRQGSVYHSIKSKTRLRVVRDIKDFQKENAWFQECVNKLDYGLLEEVHDLLPEVKKDLKPIKDKSLEQNPLEKGEAVMQDMFRQYNEKHPQKRKIYKGLER